MHSDLRRFLRQRAQQPVALFRYGVQFLPCLLSNQRVAREMFEIASCAATSLRGHLMSGDPGARRICGRKKGCQLRQLAQNQIGIFRVGFEKCGDKRADHIDLQVMVSRPVECGLGQG